MKMTLPGMTEHPDLNFLFLKFYRDARDIFFDDVELESVYGGFPGSKLCGGRNSFGVRMPLDEIERLVDRYNALGVACNVTFTNQFADDGLIDSDGYSRAIMDLFARLGEPRTVARVPFPGLETGTCEEEGVRNGIVLYTDALENYVKAHYAGLMLISSTTKGLDTASAVNADLKRFDRVVLNYNFTKSSSFVCQIEERARLEIMVNEYCSLACPHREEHYAQTSRDQMRGKPSGFICRHEPEPQALGFMAGLVEGSVFLKNAEIRCYVEDYGIRHFKIVGRGLARYDVVDSYLYYLIKPEHWYEVRDYLIHHGYL